MHLTNSEFKAFKSRFQSIHWPDEKFRVPIEVESPDGRSTWLEYLSASEFRDAAAWVDALRGNSPRKSSSPPSHILNVDLKPRRA